MELGLNEKIEIQPCTEEGMVTLEAKLGEKDEDYFDPEIMKLALSYSPFKDVKYSKDIGYAFALYKGKRIHIFKQGKIIIRRADNPTDALQTLKICIKTLLPAVLCDHKKPVIGCYRGEFKECLKDCVPLKKLIMGDAHTLRFLDIMKNPPEQVRKRKAVLEILVNSMEHEGMEISNYSELIESERKAVHKSMVESEDPIELSTNLSMLAVLDNLEEILNVLYVEKVKRETDIKEILDAVCDTMKAILEGDQTKLESAQKKNEEILSRTTHKNLKGALVRTRNVSRSVLKTVLKSKT
ncbi:MAG: hypothetical protein KAI64_00980 [Thermoplasmata archaeon]|nr:hypothetical protein [Thermoplasmata archaeon]